MSGRRAAPAWLLLCAVASQAHATTLGSARAFTCSLGDAPRWEIALTGIDRARGTAALVEAGTTPKPATLLATESGLTFIAEAAAGSLIFTTIFAGPPGEPEFYAVQSRHMTVMTGIPQLGQQAGTCRATD